MSDWVLQAAKELVEGAYGSWTGPLRRMLFLLYLSGTENVERCRSGGKNRLTASSNKLAGSMIVQPLRLVF